MSRIVPASGICELALGAIGAFPVTESAPVGEHMRRAAQWLDMLLAETAGVGRMFSRLTSTLSFDITNGTSEYDLQAALGDDWPDDGIQFVVDAWLHDENDNRTRLEIVTLDTFENVPLLPETGTPIRIYLDRQDAPTLRIFPTPDVADTLDWTISLVGQKYSPNVAPSGVLGTKPSASVLHAFGQSWQRWMVFQLAHDLGSGPIHKLGEASLTRFAAMAKVAETKLLAFENRPHDTEDPVCKPWGL